MPKITLDEIAYRVLPQVRPGRALADAEWRTLVRCAEALLEDLPFEIAPERVADNVEAFLIEGRSRRAWRCRVLLTLIEHATWGGYGRPFSRLDAQERRQLIAHRFVDGRHVWGICAKIRYLVLMGPTATRARWARSRCASGAVTAQRHDAVCPRRARRAACHS